MSNSHSATDGRAVEHRKRYVDRSNSKSKTCMIHGTGHYFKECKVLWGFVTKHAAAQPTEDRSSNPVPRQKFQKNQENHAIINNVVDEILMNEAKKVSYVNHEAPECLEDDYNYNNLYQVENTSLYYTKGNID